MPELYSEYDGLAEKRTAIGLRQKGPTFGLTADLPTIHLHLIPLARHATVLRMILESFSKCHSSKLSNGESPASRPYNFHREMWPLEFRRTRI